MLLGEMVAQAHEGHEYPPAGKVVTSVQVIGNGQFTFESVPGFGTMPDGVNAGPTHGALRETVPEMSLSAPRRIMVW